MDIVKAARQLRPGTTWNLRGDVLEQAQDGAATVSVPTLAELQPVMDSDTTPAAITAIQRSDAIEQLMNDHSANAKVIRAVLLTILDENNILRQWIEAFKAQSALATTLPNLQTRIASLPAMPDRTPAQGKTSVQNKLNAGTAD